MSNIWAEVWTRPGSPTFGRVHDFLPALNFGLTDGVNQVGGGNATIPSSWDGFDDVLLIDGASSVSSLIRYYSAADPTSPFFEWLPNNLIPTSDKDTFTVNTAGVGVKGILGYARLEAWDWDGTDSFAPKFPDWIYGGTNILSNPGLEENQIVPLSYELTVTATGGNYTLTDGTDTTSNIAFNASPATIETRIQTDLTAFTDIVVAQVSGIYIITYVQPPYSPTLSINTGGLTGGSATLLATQDGGAFPNPWTKAAPLVNGLPKNYGMYDNFGVSDVEAHSGSFSLLVDPGPVTATGNRNAGAQQVISVTPGGIYQAGIWVFPTSATNEFRLGIFGVGEEIIAFDSNGVSGGTWTQNVWNHIVIPDVIIPDNVSQIIFRIQTTLQGPINPAVFYVDDAEFNEGLAAATVGGILSDIYDDATVNHVADGRLVWEDEANPGTPYLTLDFSDTVDSNGNAWADSAISIRLTMRLSYSQIMARFATSYGYEYRIVPDDPELGTWLWQVYNPGTMSTDYTAAATPAVQGGASDVIRGIRRFTPGSTDVLVEGLERVTGRAQDAGLVTALGRIEGASINREAADLGAATLAATEGASLLETDSDSFSYTLVDPQDEPLTSYSLGDLLNIVDPPEIPIVGSRFMAVVATLTPNSVEWEVQFGSASITNPDAAVADAVAGLLAKFEYPDELGGGGGGVVGGQGGMMTVAVAAFDASSMIQKQSRHCL